MTYILNSNEALSSFSHAGGGKAGNLARLSQKGFDVPEWFCVSVKAFDEFLAHNKIQMHPVAPFDQYEKEVAALFLKSEMPPHIAQAIQEQLKAAGMQETFVAVRSSGLDEDSADHSFAGQFSSYLFQKGWKQIEESLKLCWASGFSERALSYRVERGLSLKEIRVGVVIQRMVNAESAGVVFSRHPIRVLDRDQILISSVWGLGEGLVSGELDSDNFEFHRKDGSITPQIAPKTHAFRQNLEGGLRKEELNGAGEKPSLTDLQVAEVARLSVELEEKLGAPQDSEWVYEGGKLYLVQTRPITNLPVPDFYNENVNGDQAILWDNSNIIESYSGVTSPLTFSFASRAYRQVYIQFCEIMGVPQDFVESKEPVFRNMLGLIRGRIYYNLANWYQLVLMLPGSSSNKGFMETMMGVKQQLKPELASIFEFANESPKYSFGKKLKLFLETLWRFWKIDTIVGDFNHHFLSVYNEARSRDFTQMSLTRQMDYYHHLEEQLLKRWQAPIINDYLCMVFFGLLKKLTHSWVTTEDDGGSLQNDLLCGEGGLESTEPTKFLMRIANKIDNGDKEFRAWFIGTPAADIWKKIEKDDGEIPGLFREFLDKYGFRCVNELKLEEPDLHDDPAFVISSVASYVRTQSYHIDQMEIREQAIRKEAEAKVKAKLKGFRRGIFFWILKQARKAVKNRENLRFARTKVFGVSRHLFRGMGVNLHRLGLIDAPRSIFYLTIEELIAFMEGRALSGKLSTLVENRRKEFEEYLKTPPPPDRFVSYGAVGASLNYPAVLAESDLLRNELQSDDPNVLLGTPCCPGVVEGTVRVVENLADAEGLEGEILVTGRTDPGWVPLYPSCKGLLIERGSLLSHSAVVARELGLPTIVGISGGLMTRLKTGQRVRVDAGKGEVRILEEE